LQDHFWQEIRTPNEAFLSKSQTFGLRQTIWADKFWGILGIFGQFISIQFGIVSPLSMFSICFFNQILNKDLFIKYLTKAVVTLLFTVLVQILIK
jgi:hypothetical protein